MVLWRIESLIAILPCSPRIDVRKVENTIPNALKNVSAFYERQILACVEEVRLEIFGQRQGFRSALAPISFFLPGMICACHALCFLIP